MKKPADRRLAKWEKSRNVGQEILQGIRDIKAGRVGRRFTVDSFAIVRAREKSRLSQSQFATLLGAVPDSPFARLPDPVAPATNAVLGAYWRTVSRLIGRPGRRLLDNPA